MSKLSIIEKANQDFSAISQYYTSRDSIVLSEEQQRILNRWQSADKILMKFPKKSIAARRLQALYPDISLRQAQIDIDNACKFWNLVKPADKGFLQRWFLEFLLDKLASIAVPEAAKAKYAATLERLIAGIAEEKLDPKLMEKNTVNIQFNVNHNSFTLSEKDLKNIPTDIRQKLLQLTSTEIDESEAIEIMES